MAILVTGGLGCIGKHLAKRLIEKGYETIISDIKILQQDGYVRGDICQYVEMNDIFKKYHIEDVFHLAGEVGRENGELFPRRCVDINVSGTINLIQLCLEYDAKLYFASTSEVYGRLADKFKLTEDLIDKMAVQPTNCYGISKLQAEQYLKHFVETYGLKAISFRFFMCYGEGEYPDPFRSAMANFIFRILTDQKITIHRNTKRSWCYIDDIVEGCILAMENFPRKGYQAYNIGRDELRSIKEMAEMICRLAGKPTSLMEYSDPGRFVTLSKDTSFEKAYRDFGFKAKIGLEEGISRTIEWQKNNVIK